MKSSLPNLRSFYDSPLGKRSAEALGHRIFGWWEDLSSLRVLTLGYGVPLDTGLGTARPASLTHFVPAQLRAEIPPGHPRVTLADDTLMPLDDQSQDRVILLHRIETARRPDRSLRDVWRILKPGGKVIIIVPSAFGLWARIPVTPFAEGQKFTGLKLANTLGEQLFHLERMRNALFFPPHSALKWLKSPTGGVLIAEAQKLGGPAHLLQAPKHALKQAKAASAAKQETSCRDNGRPQ